MRDKGIRVIDQPFQTTQLNFTSIPHPLVALHDHVVNAQTFYSFDAPLGQRIPVDLHHEFKRMVLPRPVDEVFKVLGVHAVFQHIGPAARHECCRGRVLAHAEVVAEERKMGRIDDLDHFDLGVERGGRGVFFGAGGGDQFPGACEGDGVGVGVVLAGDGEEEERKKWES